MLDKDSNLLFLLVEGGTVTQNVRPFEPEPDAMKIRNKTQAMLTTEASNFQIITFCIIIVATIKYSRFLTVY